MVAEAHGARLSVRILLRNTGSSPAANWYVRIVVPGTVEEAWGAVPRNLGNGTILLIPLAHNTVIPPGGAVEIGLITKNTGLQPRITGCGTAPQAGRPAPIPAAGTHAAKTILLL